MVGLAHGSRHPGGSAAIAGLLAQVARLGGVPTEPAYLDLAEPDLDAVAARLAAAGHRRAVVVPLLFTAAYHATVDVPQAVAAAGERSGVELVTAGILGTGAEVEALLRASAAGTGVAEDATVLLVAVGSSDAAANAAVADLAERWSAGRPGPVRVAFGTTSPRVREVVADLDADAGTAARVAVVPLFLAPGLLLDPVTALAAERGWVVAPPLGDLAAPLVLARYRSALSRPGTGAVPRPAGPAGAVGGLD